MLPRLSPRRHGRLEVGFLACYLLVLLVAPLVHDEAVCVRSPNHCVTCAFSGMAAASDGRVSTISDSHMAPGGRVRPYGHLLPDTILPSHKTGRSPPAASLEHI